MVRDELKLPIKKGAAKTTLTTKSVKIRIRFCHQYKDFTPEQWFKVMWSDESLFKVISAKKHWVHLPTNVSHFHPRWCNRTVKHLGEVMI